MTYAFIRDVPATEAQYAEVQAAIDASTGGETPKGLVAHLALRRPGGLRYIDVWETQADWERFRDEHVSPAVGQMMAKRGVETPAEPPTAEPIEVVHAWVGTPG